MKRVASRLKTRADHVLSHDALQHIVQKLDDRLKAVLGCAGDELHCYGRFARPPKDDQNDEYGHEHPEFVSHSKLAVDAEAFWLKLGAFSVR